MKIIKMLLTLSLPIFLLYLINIIIFNKYPIFFGCFCGSSIYIPSLNKISSCEKLINNFLHKEKIQLSSEDFMNFALIFILTCLFMGLIYIIGNHTELGLPFFGTSIIFLFMSHFKIPRKFFLKKI